MSIIVNPHNQQEETALLAFLDNMKYEYTHADDDWFDDLGKTQQESIMRGLAQADRGETITHQEAIARLGL